MIHRILDLAAMLSLLLCLAAAAVWIGIVETGGALRFGRSQTEYILCLRNTGLSLQTMQWKVPLTSVYRASHLPFIRTGIEHFTFCPGGRTSGGRSIGFEAVRRENVDPAGAILMTEYWLHIPLWALTLIFAVPPFLSTVATYRARRRANHNLCPTCSYDLRAHVPGDRCPECGTPVPS